MTIPPEILFHRFFQEISPRQIFVPPGSSDPRPYRGKKDLSDLQPSALQSLLVGIQESFNEDLRNEKRNVPEHVDHPPFHLDYVDSSIPNALAFQYKGYSFIGITTALITLLWNICVRLSGSTTIATLLRVRLMPEERDRLHILLFRSQLNFVVSHEYTHHVHEHVSRWGAESILSNEILDVGETADLDQQTREVDADGYAAYHVLSNLIDGGGRSQAVSLLRLDAEPNGVQDEVLFSCFVVALGAYLFVRPPITLDSARLYRLTHPPQSARMNSLMHQAIGWCRQNRTALEAWMTPGRFQVLMNGVAEATWGMNGGGDWAAQVAFLQSEEGSEYIRKLGRSLKTYI